MIITKITAGVTKKLMFMPEVPEALLIDRRQPYIHGNLIDCRSTN